MKKSDQLNEDFYYENGLLVFTEKYHLKRGYCCESGCRHCPYELKKNVNESSDSPKAENRNLK